MRYKKLIERYSPEKKEHYLRMRKNYSIFGFALSSIFFSIPFYAALRFGLFYFFMFMISLGIGYYFLNSTLIIRKVIDDLTK